VPPAGSARSVRKDEDQLIEAEFDPDPGIVTVYKGRKEFRELEKAAPGRTTSSCKRSTSPKSMTVWSR
jgi:hypothetical protein